MTVIYRAEISTRNFDFWAYGKTKTEALAVLRETFEGHIHDRGGSYTWHEIKNDVYTYPCKTGQGHVS